MKKSQKHTKNSAFSLETGLEEEWAPNVPEMVRFSG